MKINRLHAIIGFLLIIVPFLGFTRGFKYGFSIVCGAVILYFAMVSIHAEITKKQRNKKHDSFVESKPKDVLKQKTVNKTIVEENSIEAVGIKNDSHEVVVPAESNPGTNE